MDMERFQIAVGHNHNVQPKNIVGAIANEGNISASLIGQIEIHDDFSTVDLPSGMPKTTFQKLKRTFICGQRLNIRHADEMEENRGGKGPRKRKHGGKRPPRNDD